MTAIKYRTADVDGFKIFYREAGPAEAPAMLLLHGFPTSSHMFRDLIPLLADRFHVVAPDLPGFGRSDMPPRAFDYTFEHMAEIIDRFTEIVGLRAFRDLCLRLWRADRLPARRQAPRAHHRDHFAERQRLRGRTERRLDSDPRLLGRPSPANRDALRAFLKPETTRLAIHAWRARSRRCVSPDGYSLDNFYLARPGADEVQLDLFGDYKTNVALYPAFQDYFRTHKPPLLAVWGKNDPFFLPPGAEAFKRDIPDAIVRFFDTGHFALETHAAEIAAEIRKFLSR